MPTYNYILSDFPLNEVNIPVLDLEIKDSSLASWYSYVLQEDPSVDIIFSQTLNTGNKNVLDYIVANHDYNMVIEPDPPRMELPVKGSSSDISFGCPSPNPLISINQTYGPNAIQVLGTGGPDLSNLTEFNINWDLTNNGLYNFSLSTDDGNPSWYLNLKSYIIEQNFDRNQPDIQLNGTGIANLDGSYWANVSGNTFILHSKTGNFTLYFSTSELAYLPVQYNANFVCADPSGFLYDSNIPVNVYGSQFNWVESENLESTSSTSFVTKASLNVIGLPQGMYAIKVSYGWSQTNTNDYFESRVMLDGDQIGQLHRVRPDVSNSTYMDFSCREFTKQLEGDHTIDLQYRQQGGNQAKIADVIIQLFRVL
jgi:hypothetical protein